MRPEPWLLLPLAGCTERHVDAAGSDTSVSEPTVQPTLALPARAVSVTESSPPYEGPERTLGDFVLDLLDCVKPGECPRSDEGKARRKAERTFNCSPADASSRPRGVAEELRVKLVAGRAETVWEAARRGPRSGFACVPVILRRCNIDSVRSPLRNAEVARAGISGRIGFAGGGRHGRRDGGRG
jgi:hypothetical protein